MGICVPCVPWLGLAFFVGLVVGTVAGVLGFALGAKTRIARQDNSGVGRI